MHVLCNKMWNYFCWLAIVVNNTYPLQRRVCTKSALTYYPKSVINKCPINNTINQAMNRLYKCPVIWKSEILLKRPPTVPENSYAGKRCSQIDSNWRGAWCLSWCCHLNGIMRMMFTLNLNTNYDARTQIWNDTADFEVDDKLM